MILTIDPNFQGNIQAGLCEAFTCTKVSRMERHRNPGGQNMAPCLDPNGTCLGGGLPIGTNCTYKKKVYTPPKFRILNPKKRRSGKCFVFLFQRGDFQVFMFIFLGRCKCGYIYIPVPCILWFFLDLSQKKLWKTRLLCLKHLLSHRFCKVGPY